MISGTAIAAGPAVATWGVETESSCPFTQGFAAGHIVPIRVLPSLADGLVGNLDPETITFDLVRRYVAGVVTVTEQAIATAMAKLVAEERVIAEGAAATAIAGVLGGRLPIAGRRVAVILSGANVDPDKLRDLI